METKNSFVCLVCVLVILLLISSCGPKTPPECQVDDDCRAKKCKTVTCVDTKCVYDPVLECCGNGICEEDIGESKCTCGSDCGKCEGKGKIEVRQGRFMDTEYLEYFCSEEDKCVFGVDPGRIKETSLIDERETTYFKIETLTTFNTPFNVKFDKFKFEIELKDTGEDLVLPIKVTGIQLKAGEIFFGRSTIDDTLDEVGDKVSTEVPVTYEPDEVEEEKRISYKLSYEYTKKIRTTRNEDESWNYREELVRDDYEKAFASRIFLVNPGEE